jgi:SAM-dependent methyltransferase
MVGVPPALECRVCLSRATSLHFVHEGSALIKCSGCGVVFSLDEPDLDRIERHYSTDYFVGGAVEYADYLADEPAHRSQARHYLEAMRRLGIGGSSLFDIGCAAGYFLDEACKAGWSVRGCDVSESAVAHCREVLGLEVARGDFLQASDGLSGLDAVTAFNVFEHLPRPRVVAERLAGMVRPGGHVVMETWDHQSWIARLLGSRWHQWDPPFVPYYYTRSALEALFPSGEWRLVHYGPFGKRISLGRALTAVRGRYLPGSLGGVVGRLAASKVGGLHLTYGLDDLVLVAFKRL